MRHMETGYLELAKRSQIRASLGPGEIEAMLARGGRFTVEEIASVTGLPTEDVRRELGQLARLGAVYTAVDFHRRAEVFWSRGLR